MPQTPRSALAAPWASPARAPLAPAGAWASARPLMRSGARGPPKPCRRTPLPGTCRAHRPARHAEIGHPFRLTLVSEPCSAYRPARLWRKMMRRSGEWRKGPLSVRGGVGPSTTAYVLPPILYLVVLKLHHRVHFFCFPPKWRRPIFVPDVCRAHRPPRAPDIGLSRRLTCVPGPCRAHRPARLWRTAV